MSTKDTDDPAKRTAEAEAAGEQEPTHEEVSLASIEVVYRAAAHELLGNRAVRERFVRKGPQLETYQRLHAPSEPITIATLKEDMDNVSAFYKSITGEASDWQKPQATYLAGILRGLKYSAVNYSSLPLEIGGRLKDRPDLIAELAIAEAEVIRSNNGHQSDRYHFVDPYFHFGMVVGFERALGKRDTIPTEIPPMPEYLR